MKNKCQIQVSENLKKEMMGSHYNKMPMKASLSLEPIISYWKEQIATESSPFGSLFKHVLEQVEQIPELRGTIKDESVLEKHNEVAAILLSSVMPMGLKKSIMAYVTSPFNMDSLYTTPALTEKMSKGSMSFDMKDGSCKGFNNMIIKACTYILDSVWGYELHFDRPFVFILTDNEKKTNEYFKSVISKEFVEILPIEGEELERPDELTVKRLLSEINNVDEWIRVIQPEKYEFRGVVRAQLIDITEEEAMSRIKYKLLESDALVKKENIRELEQLVRDYFRKSDLSLGLSAIDYPSDQRIKHKYKIRHDLLAEDFTDLLVPENQGSILEKALSSNKLIMCEDLPELPERTPIEEKYLEKGINSIVISPMTSGKTVIGFLELGMGKTFSFNSLDSLKVHDLEPLFTTSLVRSREEIDNSIDAIIREQYTAIHPSVEWRFVDSAYNLMEQRETDPYGAKPEPIVFHDVIPLYAQADISNSSATRNKAIQKDLIENLRKVEVILLKSQESLDLPIIRHYGIKTRETLESITDNINSNDEVSVIDFLRDEIYPLLQMIKEANPDLGTMIDDYCSSLDPALGIVYNKRKDYEDSVAMINDTIASYLEMKEEEIQKTIPHYFEKYKTDGVEFDIYVGQSLMRNGSISHMHIKNMRLWQLILLCDIGRLVKGIGPKLPIPLKTSQLALVHSNPLSIRFRMDEKRFDVDGAYNVRYEIIKKRIDKAIVKGETQRLTKPGTISIVYSQDKDRKEYEEYISFLLKNSYITEEVEHFDLEKTQGVEGLKAFRLEINTETDLHDLETSEALKQAREILAGS